MVTVYNPFTLQGKTIFVTGASSGIGRCSAIACSKMGATLCLTGRNETRLNETVSNLSGSGHLSLTGDLTQEENIARIVSELPKLDGVVFSAGVNDKSLIKHLTAEKMEKVMGVNFVSPALTLKELSRQKKLNNGSSIVMISSISAFYSTIANTMYAASKGALDSMVRVAALELASKKIRVNGIRPGVVESPLLDDYPLKENLEEFVKQVPLGRFAKPEEIAYGVIYCLSDASAWMTGTVFNVDGGITLR